MDLLSTVLQSLHLVDSAIALLTLETPWGFRLDERPQPHVFVFEPLDADFHLRVGDQAPVHVQRGDTAVVIGECFEMVDAPSTPMQPLSALWPVDALPRAGRDIERSGPLRLHWGDAARPAPAAPRIVALALLLRDVAHSPMLGVLPRCIVLRHGATPLYPWSVPVLRFVELETQQGRPGYEAAARLLARLTFVELVRTYVLGVGADEASWLKGIADPKIGRALALIYHEPGRDWRLETLAEASHMARSTFSRRFLQLVGRSPMEYLGSVRMHHAAERLAAGERVQQVAAAVGYQSDWAFRRAFAAQFGVSPKHYRRHRPG